MLHSAATSDPGLARELTRARARLASQERQIQELNHRVANSLQLAADLLIFEQLRSRDPQAQAALEASHARLVAVAALHRYLNDHADRPSVALRPFLTGLGEAIGASTGLRCSIQCEALSIPGDMAQQLAIAVNELAINAAKHAYGGKPGGRLSIDCRRESAMLAVSVADEGPGLGGRGAAGLGTSIVAAIVRDLKGSLSAQSDEGARFTLRAPLPGATPRPLLNRSFEGWNLAD